MSFRLTILGSSSALPTSERFPTAQLLNVNERFFLIDCGEGTQMQLRKYRIRLGKIHHIFISHLHGDHIFGIFGLLSSFSLLGREEPLHVFGPEGLEELVLDHLKFFQNDLGFELYFHRIQCRRPALVHEDKNITVLSLPMIHRIPTCGFLFREKPRERNILKEKIIEYNIPVKDIVKIKQGADFILPDGTSIPNALLTLPPPAPRSYAYCSDTRPNKVNIPHLEGVDLLYHEATFAQEDASLAHETFHSTARQAAELAAGAGVGRLLIGHFSSRYKDISLLETEAREIFPGTTLVNDGDRFEVD
ncbi:MAG: ribonuclease Z [Bacteroides sp. SM23_62]|nr:MAG: ribonuclease Z [Bacteroides sp. SM23_62]